MQILCDNIGDVDTIGQKQRNNKLVWVERFRGAGAEIAMRRNGMTCDNCNTIDTVWKSIDIPVGPGHIVKFNLIVHGAVFKFKFAATWKTKADNNN